MNRQEVRERLEMKSVETRHWEQFNDLLRYVFQVTNEHLQTFGWGQREIAQAKLPILKQADVLGWFDGDKLISQLAVYPFQVNIFGQIYEMGGLTGVGTYPEYANLGLMNQLMRQALMNMREQQQSISYLFPYSIPFYRRKGWEIISDKISFEVKDTQLPKVQTLPGNVERVSIEHPEVKAIYRRFALQKHAAMLRNELAWEEYMRWDLDDLTVAVYYNDDHVPMGYLLYWIAEDVFYIKELVFIDEEARAGLWNFISAHFSMVSRVKGHTFTDEPLAFLFDESDIKETIAPYFMGRIVDIRLFVEQYPFQPQPVERKLTFALRDPMLDWNEGIFTLHVSEDGSARLSEGGDNPSAAFTIQTMTTMLMGYKRPTYLARINRFQADEPTVHMLENLIIREKPYFSDYF